MLNSTKWLLMAEVVNEVDGGDSPTTLGSALESVLGGYNPDSENKMSMEPVQRELITLIAEQGPGKLVADLLTNADWESRAKGSLQILARKGE